MKDFSFSASDIRVRRGASLEFFFDDAELHDVTLANGPRGFGTPHANNNQTRTVRFPVRGEYRWFCSLHPIAMTGRTIAR